MTVADEAKTKMLVTLEHFKGELKNLRTNRANPGMVEGVRVEVYGTQCSLKEIASITVPEPRRILITPFDPQNAPAIAKAIEKANLNLQPILETHMVSIPVPPMDQASRANIAKRGKQEAEKAKITIREIRRKHNELLRDQTVTEDMRKKTEKTIQELTDQFCRQIDELFTLKEKEIMAI